MSLFNVLEALFNSLIIMVEDVMEAGNLHQLSLLLFHIRVTFKVLKVR